METFVGKNGEKRRRVKEKIVFYVCDTDLTGEKKMKQSKIYFTRKQIGGEGGGDTSSTTRGDLLQVQRGRVQGQPWRIDR